MRDIKIASLHRRPRIEGRMALEHGSREIHHSRYSTFSPVSRGEAHSNTDLARSINRGTAPSPPYRGAKRTRTRISRDPSIEVQHLLPRIAGRSALEHGSREIHQSSGLLPRDSGGEGAEGG